MNNEYRQSQKEQKSLFKKYQKYMNKTALFLPISVAAFFLTPYIGISNLLINVFGAGESMAATVSIFTQLGLTLGTLSVGLINALKANFTKRKLNNAMDYEEGLIEGIEVESSKKDEKINSLENQLSKQKENTNSKINKKIENIKTNDDYIEEEEKEEVKKLGIF